MFQCQQTIWQGFTWESGDFWKRNVTPPVAPHSLEMLFGGILTCTDTEVRHFGVFSTKSCGPRASSSLSREQPSPLLQLLACFHLLTHAHYPQSIPQRNGHAVQHVHIQFLLQLGRKGRCGPIRTRHQDGLCLSRNHRLANERFDFF